VNLNLLVLRSNNIEAAKEFYEKLGFSFTFEKHGNGPEHYSSNDPGFVFEIYPNKIGVECEPIRIGFELSNALEVVKTIPVVNKREEGLQTIYIIQDPDGHKIEIQQKP
jgi:catechol 2,3-dioxygenase-like lactoylglutathione lyase family enzyme